MESQDYFADQLTFKYRDMLQKDIFRKATELAISEVNGLIKEVDSVITHTDRETTRRKQLVSVLEILTKRLENTNA